MPLDSPSVYNRLAARGIHGPGSEEVALFESRIARYFEREFRRHERDPRSLDSLCISTEQGPMMEDTDALIHRHYDERIEFFSSFLDTRYLAYSMAYYGDTAEAVRTSSATLEEAQRAKCALIAERAELAGHERILNIGCGFGSLETFLLEEHQGLEIVAVTPSSVQANFLKKRMRNPGDPLGNGRFRLIEASFQHLSARQLGRAAYDLVLSVGVLEHVLNMRSLMSTIADILVPGGRTFHHFITSRSVIPELVSPDKTRIGLYFPGGRVWPHKELGRHTERLDLASSWFINGLNYRRTLEEWHKRFWSNVPSIYGSHFDEEKIAYWNEYFSLCKAMFSPMNGEFYGNSQYLFRLRS